MPEINLPEKTNKKFSDVAPRISKFKTKEEVYTAKIGCKYHIIMFKFICSFFVFLFFIPSCYVSYNKPVSYKGRSNINYPYVDLHSIDKRIIECDRNTGLCTVRITVRPWVHNPTKYRLKGNFICEYKVDELREPDISSKLITIGPRKSIKFKVNNAIFVRGDHLSKLTVGCFFRYKEVI